MNPFLESLRMGYNEYKRRDCHVSPSFVSAYTFENGNATDASACSRLSMDGMNWLALNKCMHILDGLIQQSLSCLFRRPSHVRRNDAVFRMK